MRVYIDLDDTLCYYSATLGYLIEKTKLEYPQNTIDFYEDVAPIPYAVTAVLTILEDYDTYILTSPSIKNTLTYTGKAKWIQKHFGVEMLKRFIICYDKSLLRGDYLIDNNTNGRGQEDFDGEFIHYGSKDFPSWLTILRYFGL